MTMTSTTADHFGIVDNVALDSSMDSTQGLLSFMTNASRQIKTYLGPDQQQKANQNKKRHQQLLVQLSKLKTQNYSFIPDILAPESTYHNTSTTTNSFYSSDSSSPASPTPSLDSVGSVEDCDAFRSSCLVKSRRQKRSRPLSSFMYHQYSGEDASIMNKRPRKYPGNNATINQNHNDYSSMTCAYTTTSPYNNTGNYTYNNNNNNTTTNNNNRSCNSNDDIYNLAPLPSPDFDDLVDCMLTEEALNEIDITNYLPAL